MVKYWIVGVRKDPLSIHPPLKVVWSGADTKKMIPYVVVRILPKGQAWYEAVDRDDRHTQPYLFDAYGYSNYQHAHEVLVKLINRGPGFTPLRGVSQLRCIPVAHGTHGIKIVIDQEDIV
jgi:hypothetical protein